MWAMTRAMLTGQRQMCNKDDSPYAWRKLEDARKVRAKVESALGITDATLLTFLWEQ